MGCISTKTVDVHHIQQFKRDMEHYQYNKNNKGICKVLRPLRTTLYNALRKSSTIQIIHSSSNPQLLRNSTRPDLNAMSVSQLKILYNFKNVIIVGDLEPYRKIPAEVSAKNIYSITYQQCQQFIKKYPIFGPEGFDKNDRQSRRLSVNGRVQISTISTTPILVFNESDIITNKTKQHTRQIYIHSDKFRNNRFYKLLNIDKIIQPPNSQDLQNQIQYYLNECKNKNKSILLIHNDKIQPQQLKMILLKHLTAQYGLSQFNVNAYLNRFLPTKGIQQIDDQQGNSKNNRKSKKNLSLHINHKVVTNAPLIVNQQMQNFINILKQFKNESNQQNVQRAYNLSILLTSNIYSHPDKQSTYRKVKVTNKNIQIFTQYENGRKLLKQLGWNQVEDNWVNQIEGKYLKIMRTDLDLAFSQYRSILNR